MTKTILICNQKGGVGKTLVADELAFALDRAEIPYNFYDLDAQGGSIHERIENKNAKITIVDTPGALQSDMVEWMKAADVIIIPTRMSNRDIPPLETMMAIVESPEIGAPVIYVMNGWNRFRASHDFVEWFTENHPYADTVILPQSEQFVQAGVEGISVCDYQPKGYCADKIRELISLVEDDLEFEITRKDV